MELVDANNLADYLRRTNRIAPAERVEVRELSGGVSNVVLLVRPALGEAFVVKQARPQLRVPQPWFCGVERVLREIDVLRLCQRVLAARPGESAAAVGDELSVDTPRLLFEDRDNFLFAMSAAPTPHDTWKERLLAGDANPTIAAACGRLLGRLHAGTWHNPDVARDLDDRHFFDDLRVDPYYRQIARVHDDLRPAIERLIESVWRNRQCLVHGDFSPKNLLVFRGGLMLIDFEVGHFGDPAFDLGFFLTHLILKSFRAGRDAARYLALVEQSWGAYAAELSRAATSDERHDLESRVAQNLAGCLLARVDGKSRVDYLADAEPVRRLSRELFAKPPHDWPTILETVRKHLPHRNASPAT